MDFKNQDLNSCICKCGSISCRNIHLHSFSNQIQKSNDHFLYSKLHHKSLSVTNSNSIIIDKCCGNCLHFHCSKCHECFLIAKIRNSKSKFIIGFDSDCLTHLEPVDNNEIIIIPEFPIALRSYVTLSEQKVEENSIDVISNSIDNLSFANHDDIENDEILSYDSDEELMFGTSQTDIIIGKYNGRSISALMQSLSAN